MLWEEKNICPDEDQTLMPQLSSTQSKSLYWVTCFTFIVLHFKDYFT
jgi:hypothetical protein